MGFEFPELPYGYDALEPYIDAKTMEIHYSKHHRAYFDKFTAAVQGTELSGKSLEEIFAKATSLPAAVRNNGGGYYNHIVYWNSMSPNGGGDPKGALLSAVEKTFGSVDSLKEKLSQAGATLFGSGFAWLIVKDGKLEVVATANQDNPLMDAAQVRGRPILALDVWEHAYYLKYQNKRPDYIKAWWNTVDWSSAAKEYEKALDRMKVAG